MDKSIEEYNLYLIKNHDYLNIIDYFSKIHRTFFPEIDISFMNYFLDLSNPEKINEFCIYEKDLRKYGLLSERTKMKDIVCKYDLLKTVDWIYQNYPNEEKHHTFFNLGVYIHDDSKRNILITPKAFKRVIFRSSNIIFVEYYMLLETVIRYYHDYQTKYKTKEEKKKNDELERVKHEIEYYEKRIEEYESYIKKIVANVDKTMDECKKEIHSILSLCE